MAYRDLVIDPSADSEVNRLVRTRVELYLRDVHAILRLPLPASGIEAGCNFTIAATLCSVVAGLSRVFLPEIRRAGDAFRQVLAAYPYEAEPIGAILGAEFATHLYDTYRNNLAHSLGIKLDWSGTQYVIEALGSVKIVRQRPGISAEDLYELEGNARPAWLGKTLELDGRTYKLRVEALYWGIRKLTERLSIAEPYATNARRILGSADAGYGLSLIGVPGPRYQAEHEISATASAVSSAVVPNFPTFDDKDK